MLHGCNGLIRFHIFCKEELTFRAKLFIPLEVLFKSRDPNSAESFEHEACQEIDKRNDFRNRKEWLARQ